MPSTGSGIDFVLPVEDSKTSWQDISIEISGLNSIKQIAIFGEGGNSGVSKIYVTDMNISK